MNKTITHKHHIIPKHMGGSDDPSNLIELTISEHAEEHKKLWETHEKKEDYIAWKFLSGQMKDPVAWLYKSSLGGKSNKGSKYCHNPKTGVEVKFRDDKIPEGFIIGRHPSKINRDVFKNITHDTSDSKWYHNPKNTEECKMIQNLNDIPTGWIIGRGNNHINDTNKTKGYKWWHNKATNKETTSIECPGDEWDIGNLPSKIRGSHLLKYSNNTAGSFWCHNPENIEESRMLHYESDIPIGWVWGRPNKYTIGKKWCHNPETSEKRMIHPDQNLDDGWVWGMKNKR